ncbi:MAG: hypothetical protein ACYTGH_19050, partial [Planctomycetota bacterium]
MKRNPLREQIRLGSIKRSLRLAVGFLVLFLLGFAEETLRAADNKPATPPNFQADADAGTERTVRWGYTAGAATFKIYRDGAFIREYASNIKAHTDANLTPGVKYSYKLIAYSANGVASDSVTCISADTEAPKNPSNLKVVGLGTSTRTITWSASYDATGIREYRIYRDGTLALTNPGSETSCVLSLSPLVLYEIGVEAIDEAGNPSGVTRYSEADSESPTKPIMVQPEGMNLMATSRNLGWSAST